MFFEKPADYDYHTCFICGRPATTVEHVIPKWLQNRYNLWDQHLQIPNETSIPYRQVVVPACIKCNTEVYGKLEKKVENHSADDSDIWKWANKIHYGLSHKDKILEWDRQNPGYKIGDVIRPTDPLERSRHFLNCISGDFKTEPDPFGSVFKFEFESYQDFKFAHFLLSSSICVCLGDFGYVAFVEDGQALKRDTATESAYRDVPKPSKVEDMLFFYAQCVEHMTRHELGQNIIMSSGFIARVGQTVVHNVEPPNKERFRAICSHLGLEWIDSNPDS